MYTVGGGSSSALRFVLIGTYSNASCTILQSVDISIIEWIGPSNRPLVMRAHAASKYEHEHSVHEFHASDRNANWTITKRNRTTNKVIVSDELSCTVHFYRMCECRSCNRWVNMFLCVVFRVLFGCAECGNMRFVLLLGVFATGNRAQREVCRVALMVQYTRMHILCVAKPRVQRKVINKFSTVLISFLLKFLCILFHLLCCGAERALSVWDRSSAWSHRHFWGNRN